MLEDRRNDIAVVDEGDNAQGGVAAGPLEGIDSSAWPISVTASRSQLPISTKAAQ
jgi:hypothetical protein